MKDYWSLNEICRTTGGSLHGADRQGIRELVIDSRTATVDVSSLFIAIHGQNHDGHQFIADLYRSGIRAFLVTQVPEGDFSGAGFCCVKDSLQALHDLVLEKRRSFQGRVAAIAGSNGKTIVKEWIYQLMYRDFSVHRSPKSYNSQIGVPLSLWLLRENHELAVIEAGISQRGEMPRLARIINPALGLFTNLGTAHQKNFGSMEEKLQEKLALFESCSKVIYRRDAVHHGELISNAMESLGCELISWSASGAADYRYTLIDRKSAGLKLELAAGGKSGSFYLPFSDEASVENALHALTFALEWGLPLEKGLEAVEVLEPVSMRLEILKGIHGNTLINDSYNADVGGLSAALDLLNQQYSGDTRVLILSDLLQSGKNEEDLYREVAALAAGKGIRQFIGIGPALNRMRHHFPPHSFFFQDTEEFLVHMDKRQVRDSAVLIKGSRRFGFERIASEWQLLTHQTRLEIDLDAMVHNLNYYRGLLKPEVKLMVMVKALSYGSGKTEIASLLQYHKVDYLAVAFVDEGIALRKAGISLPLMVMNPHPSAFAQMLDYRLEPEIYSFKGLEALLSLLEYRAELAYPVHIKLDTGMHRLGFSAAEILELGEKLAHPACRVGTVFSHLAASGEVEHDDFSRQQIREFTGMADYLSSMLQYAFGRHILNSSGIVRFPEAQFQMVRLGIGLHGIGIPGVLQPAASFKTQVSQVRHVRKGDSIGYSRTGRAVRDMQVATIPVGYADGLDRRLGNGKGALWINGDRALIVGHVCMDMAMLDVSHLEVAVGDEVEIFGKHISINEMAESMQAIPYEILTSIPERVKRVYLQES